jgi:hypothetical protein
MKIKKDICLFLQLIKDDSFDLAIRMLQEKGSKIANAQFEYKEDGGEDDNGETALMLATELKPVSKSLVLIDALMEAGASMDACEYEYFGHIFFHACRRGVDPAIFDKLIMWDSVRENLFQEWWSKYDCNGNGVFVLACESHNFSLAEHILSLAFTQHRQENFLESMPNHILKSLVVPTRSYGLDEEFLVKWLRLIRTYVDEIPQEYTIGKNDIDDEPTREYYPHNGHIISLPHFFELALRNGEFGFIEEYAALFIADYKLKKLIWQWLHKGEGNPSFFDNKGPPDKVIPIKVRKIALSYERNDLWNRNKDIALVLVRAYKAKYHSDILEHVSSFVYKTSLNAKARDSQKRDAHYCCHSRGWHVGKCVYPGDL